MFILFKLLAELMFIWLLWGYLQVFIGYYEFLWVIWVSMSYMSYYGLLWVK